MNVFVLNAGRCGSTTWIQACRHIRNYSAAHESRIHLLGERRLAYPANHIEADNRLSWFLGRLDRQYGDDAFYLHLTRDRDASASSFSARSGFGIMKAYREGILLHGEQGHPPRELALDYLDTIDSNIALFLKDKRHQMRVSLESAKQDFPRFWQWIGAEGDLERALAEFDICYNRSVTPAPR
ncbi:MAG TPA: hypothetical protein ENK50_11785 [Sedimenticola sp.]|nr:hypothetical protein [Sedimenticola sp.]